MTAAIILPASLPLLIQSPSDGKPDNLATTLKAIAYFSLWVVFGLLPFPGDRILHEMTENGAPLAAASGFIAPTITLAAGIYQITPFKRRFTERCRPSKEHARQAGGPMKQSVWLGMNCIGSCWSLMLFMFALGYHQLHWMVILSGVISAERLSPRGSSLAKWVGAGLVFWGIFSVVGTL